MGIQVEFNPDLALRKFNASRTGRKLEECLPQKLEVGRTYDFLKEGQRLYWLEGEIPLRETKGNGKISRPIASVIISEATHFRADNKNWTAGKYEVKEVIDPLDSKIRFEGYTKLT